MTPDMREVANTCMLRIQSQDTYGARGDSQDDIALEECSLLGCGAV
jgi:hypothetical protein